MIYGGITNPKTGKHKDILVKVKPNSVTDILMGGSLIVAGVSYLVIKAFKNGVAEFEMAEVNTMRDLGLIKSSAE